MENCNRNAIKQNKTIYNRCSQWITHISDILAVCLGAVGFPCAANVPVQGNGHVASPDGVPAQQNGSTD